jgi:UDP-N-acetylmuramoyl-L-alanyl-D-glutamate--2,6-diaminopimelate ligase
VSLRRLLPEAEFLGGFDLVVSGASSDASAVEPGQVFISIDGTRDDLSRAIERGACGLIVEQPLEASGVIQVVVSNTRSAFATIAQALAGDPSRWLPVVGVTGLGGKTAASIFLRSIFEADGRRVGMIPGEQHPATRVRDGSRIATNLKAALDRECDLAVLSLSAESLAERVADGLDFDAALICPGRPQVLPSGSDARYSLRAMCRMTRSVRSGGVIAVEAGDAETGLLAATNLSARVMTYGVGEGGEIMAEVEDRDLNGTRFRLRGLDRERLVELRPIGEPALLAALGAAAIARGYGASDGAIVAGLESVSCIPGRLQPIATGPRQRVFVDRAASGRSLRAAARILRERVSGEIITVLAVTTDPARAAEIVLAVESEGLRVVLTRAEPASVVMDLESTLNRFRQPGRVRMCLDRAKALEAAMELCGPDDVVAVFGTKPDEWQADSEVVHAWLRRGHPPVRRSA